MLKKLFKYKYQILELIIIFLITLFYNLLCSSLTGDEIWNYGFSYNISTGLIPYKDFNMIITPLFPCLGAIFLTIFGKTFLVYNIFNSFICTTIFYCIKKQIKYNYYLVYLILLMNSYASYNLLCILFLYILIPLEKQKNKNYFIGILLGLTFITKQNIGIYLCIPSLFKKDIKIIFKRIIGFLIPVLILIMYLILTNSIHEFIDYTILGLFSFSKENSYLSPIATSIFIITSIYLIYSYIKNKDIKVIYILMFQLLMFPMNDIYHVMISLIPCISYILNKIKITKIISLVFTITYLVTIFSTNIYSFYNRDINYPNNTNTFKYKNISTKLENYIIKNSNLIKNIDKDIELFIIAKDSYLIKLESSIKINKYDLLNEGNLGKRGQEGIINDIENTCNNKDCLFLLELESEKTIGYAKKIKDYIEENYTGGIIKDSFVIYKNY